MIDIGTGTGIWAIEFAESFPDCIVEGTDLSPIQPTWVPPNTQFVVDDCSKLDEYYKSCDLIHLRGLFGCLRDWPAFYQSAYKVLVPGGWIEQVEISFELKSVDGSLAHDHVLAEWGRLLVDMGNKFGKSLRACDSMEGDVQHAGFKNVVKKVFQCPINSWPKDPHLKDIGIWNRLYWLKGIEGWCLALLTRISGVSNPFRLKGFHDISLRAGVLINRRSGLMKTYRFS